MLKKFSWQAESSNLSNCYLSTDKLHDVGKQNKEFATWNYTSFNTYVLLTLSKSKHYGERLPSEARRHFISMKLDSFKPPSVDVCLTFSKPRITQK